MINKMIIKQILLFFIYSCLLLVLFELGGIKLVSIIIGSQVMVANHFTLIKEEKQ